MNPRELSERLIDFAARCGKVVDALPDTRMGRHVASQMVRSATAPAAMYEEACAAESRADFVHKLGVALKELRETSAWLRMTVRCGLMGQNKLEPLIRECGELCGILGQSINTATRRKSVKPAE